MHMLNYVVFFFSSRRRHTRYWRDWSSDVCSSDLMEIPLGGDVVLAINDRDVRKIDDVLGYLQQATQVGETVTLTVWRDGQIIQINVTLGARPSLQESA